MKALHKQAKELAIDLAAGVPAHIGGYVIYSFQTNPILVGYRDRRTDEWVTLAEIGIGDDSITVNGEVATVDAVKRAKEQVRHGQTVPA